MPLFLSEYDQPYDQDGFDDEGPDYTFGSKQEKPRTARLVIGLVAVTAFAATVGYFSIDTMRSVLVNAKASLASVAPSFGDATPSEPAAPPPRVAQAAAPEPRIAAPEAQAVYRGAHRGHRRAARTAPASKPMDAFASMPSREDITAAYQSAMKGGGPVALAAPAAKSGQVAAVATAAPAVAAVAPPAPQVTAPGARRIDPDELAGC